MNVLTIKQEAEDVTQKNGYYIPPYRFKMMAKCAEKISSLLVGRGKRAYIYGNAHRVKEH